MTTATAPTMNPTGLDDHAQALLDARLDTIERMLLGQVPRADRLAIVRDVESQVHDLLAERDPNDTDRDAVIAALGRLDPPEAYLMADAEPAPRSVPPAAAAPRAARSPAARPAGRPRLVAAKTSGILGIVAFLVVGLQAALWSLAAMGVVRGSSFLEFFFLGSLVISLPTSLLAVVFAATSRLPTAWAVTGLVTGLLSFMLSSMALGLLVYAVAS